MGAKPLNFEANQFLSKVLKIIDTDGYRELENFLIFDYNQSAENYKVYVP